MTSNLEDKFNKWFIARVDQEPDLLSEPHIQLVLREWSEEAFALGTLNGLDKAIELLPEGVNHEAAFNNELNDVNLKYFDRGFNKARSQILSKINEERKLWN